MNVKKAPMNGPRVRMTGAGVAGAAVLCAALLLSVQAYALSLGGMQVRSALDEPLRAEIPLGSVDAGTLDSLEVTLGTEEDFRRANVPRPEHLKQLEFTVSENGSEPAVLVTTEQPVKEPFLHFLIAVDWRGGKLVREYTGLLDPPLYSGEAPATVASPAIEESAEPAGRALELAAPTDPTSAPTPDVAARAAEYGPTRAGDTLWDIASKLDTTGLQADVNVFQIMVALLRQNPDAFVDNNMNRLKTGRTLQLDELGRVAAVSPDEAGRIYTAQLEEWESYKTRVAGSGGAPAAEQATVADASAQAGQGGEGAGGPAGAAGQGPDDGGAAAEPAGEGGDEVLRIVQADVDDAGQSEGASAGNDLAGEVRALRSQVASLEETLESRTLENEELRERVRLLENQLQNAQRLVELESQELAAAQQAAAQQDGAGAVASDSTSGQADSEADGEPTAAGSGEQPGSTPAAADSAGPEAGTQDTAQAGQQVQPQDSQSAQQAAAVGGGQDAQGAADGGDRVRQVANSPFEGAWWSRLPDMLRSSWMWLVGAGAGLLVLLLGVLIFMRRRQSIAEFEESILSGGALDQQPETAGAAAETDTSFLSDFGTAGMGTMQADEVDPLAEAEVYLAYGRDEQAEDVLKEAARRDPERAEIKLKLMEIYKQRGDVNAFETLAEELYPAGDQVDPEVWRQVTEMGRELNPDNPLFQPSTEPRAAGAAAAGLAAGAYAGQDQPGAAARRGAQTPPEAGGRTTAADNAAADNEVESRDFGVEGVDMAQLGAAGGDSGQSAGGAQDDTGAGDAAGGTGMPDFGDFGDFELELDTVSAPESGDGDQLDPGEDFLQGASGNVDPGERPFPPPEQQLDLDRELERLAGEREPVSAAGGEEDNAADGAGNAAAAIDGPGDDGSFSTDFSWDTAATDSDGAESDTLELPGGDDSTIEFDLSSDDADSGVALDPGSGAGERAAGSAAHGPSQVDYPGESQGESQEESQGGHPGSSERDTAASRTPGPEGGDDVLELDAGDLPSEEMWAAAAGTDAPPEADAETDLYTPLDDDVQSVDAQPYDEAETKLDLARAYMDMGDRTGARSIIDEVMREGDPAQRDRAAELASQL